MENWTGFAVALGVGLLIGVERERGKGEGQDRRIAGLRTFAVAAVAGNLAFELGGIAILAAALAATGVLAAAAALAHRSQDPGITTELALLTTVLLGGLAATDPSKSAAVGAILAVSLAAKDQAHGFVKHVIREDELADILLLAVASLVVLPLLPDHPLGPWGGFNPRTIWLVVILSMAIGAAGHVAVRLVGSRAGLPVAGFFSGFVSSTATIAGMAARTTTGGHGTLAAAAGAALSTVATFIQMALLVLAVSRDLLALIAPPLAAGAVVAALWGSGLTLFAFRKDIDSGPLPEGRMFSLRSALTFGAIVMAVSVAAAALRHFYGTAGVMIGAVIGGLADPHAASVSVASMVVSGDMGAADAVTPVLVALSVNAASKVIVAWATGSGMFAATVTPGIVLSLTGAWLAAIAL